MATEIKQKCPLNLSQDDKYCQHCMYCKEGLCDWPYARWMNPDEIKFKTIMLTAEYKAGVENV